mgnify:CR=1 FL=1
MLLKPLAMAQEIVRQCIFDGESVVDATLGNGHDALFLAKCVGSKGVVIGFDVQEYAIKSSTERLIASAVPEGCFRFYCCGHEKLATHVESPVSAVMFNLGYLPHADKALITSASTTLPALEQSLIVLRAKGVLTIMCYPGHEGGECEAEAVETWAEALDRKSYRVLRYGMLNGPNQPPFLIAIEKVR